MKPSLEVMLHDDWEVFGDGTGNPEELMFDPAKRILDICDKYGIRYTFFAEFGQQLAMLNSCKKEHLSWANTWEAILKDAVQRGHDVQLHFHPQWIGADYKNGKWELDYKKWAISSLSEHVIYDNLKEGKDYLESLLQPILPGYKVLAFRAGGWLNQPSQNIYNALLKLGIKAEVSVRKGLVRDYGDFGRIDFSNAPSNLLYWYADKNDFAEESNFAKEIISIPTFGKEIKLPLALHVLKENSLALWFYYKVFKISKKNDQTYSPKLEGQKNNTIHCNFGKLHYLNILHLIDGAISECKRNQYNNVPFVMLAHSKSFYSYKNFEKLIKRIYNNKELVFLRTQDVVENIFTS